MTRLKIIEWPHPTLETRAEEVTLFDDAFKAFVQDMHETMRAKGGIGLAANQVNVLKRVTVIEIPYMEPEEASEDHEPRKEWHDKTFTFVNPRIIHREGKQKYLEGCLSFPELFEWVERADKITVEAEDENGVTFRVDADGTFSVCLQHEIDHLDGIVFFKRMSRLKAQIIKKKMQKRHLVRG
ncbi:MAG: peptide deformylase [Zetaproteobacteria bacterium]|nr:peptide deformylase [Zetaproteobacteria bacterium]